MKDEKQRFLWSEYTVGVCYYPEHWEESLWESDLDRMLAAGIRVVRIAEFAWTITEPEEDIFRFDFFDRFLALCQEKEMKVIFGTPTATPPAWLTAKYPEVLNADLNGVPYEHGARRHYNYNSPIYREKVKTIVSALAEHYGQHPAICGWQIDNELNCETCEFHSEADQLAFRSFLRQKYGDLETLNRAWGAVFWNQTYTDWQQVRLPGHVLNRGWNPHQRLDYIRFVSASARSFCKLQADIIRRYMKPGDFITTNGLFWHLDNPRLYEESLDIFGYDSYPNFAFGLGRTELLKDGYGIEGDLNDRASAMYLSEVRGICPHFSILEQQSGAGSWVSSMENPMPRPGQIKFWAMQSIAHGADFVSFFRWRTCRFGTELYWHGILDYDNRDNRRLREVSDFAQTLKKLAPLCGADYVAPMALVKDFDNWADAEVDTWHGKLTFPSEAAIYQQAQLSHVPCDILHLEDDTALARLRRYAVLIYPHPAIMTEEKAKLLKAYVEQGGTLILGCRSGYKQMDGQAVMLPAPGMLREITGTQVTESGLQHPAEPTVTVDWDEQSFSAPVFHDQLQPCADSAAVLAKYTNSWFAGTPALIENRLGLGRCLHWGSVFTRELTKRLFAYTGLSGHYDDLLELPEAVEIAERRKDARRFLILLNYLPEKQEIRLHTEMLDLIENKRVSESVWIESFGALVLEML